MLVVIAHERSKKETRRQVRAEASARSAPVQVTAVAHLPRAAHHAPGDLGTGAEVQGHLQPAPGQRGQGHRHRLPRTRRRALGNQERHPLAGKPRHRGGAGGFICKHNIYNQFIDLSKQDGNWDNRFIGDKFIESWKTSSETDDIAEWKKGKIDMIIRLFVKDIGDSKYTGKGIYYYNGSSQTSVMWSLLN